MRICLTRLAKHSTPLFGLFDMCLHRFNYFTVSAIVIAARTGTPQLCLSIMFCVCLTGVSVTQATLKTNTKEFSPLMRLPPVLVSESDMVIKAVVPSIQLRVEEVIDLAVPLVLKPKKPFVFAKHSAGQEPAPPAPLTTLSTSMVTPLPSMARKESRKVLEQKFSFSGGTAAGMGLSTRDMGVGTSDVIIPPPVPVPSRLTPVAPLLGSIPEGKSALSSSTLGSIPEGKSTPIRGPSPGRLLLRTGDSNGGASKTADGEAKSSNSARKTARSANTCDLMVPDRKLKPVMETLSGGTPASTPPTFQDVMALVESRLRGMAAGAVTDPAAAVESMQRSCAVLADAVALTARRAINLSSQSREENVLLNKNIGLLVQLLAESQAAEMESTLARIHGPKP